MFVNKLDVENNLLFLSVEWAKTGSWLNGCRRVASVMTSHDCGLKVVMTSHQKLAGHDRTTLHLRMRMHELKIGRMKPGGAFD